MTFGKKVGGGRRERTRHPLLLAAWLTSVGHHRRVAVVDLSAEGAKLQDVEGYARGAEVWFRIYSFERLATIKWARGGFAGISFDVPLTRFELRELHRQDAVWNATKFKPGERLALDDWNQGLTR